jgi:hypothetical protein
VPPPRLLVHEIFPAFHTHLDWSPPSISCWPIDFPARREERPNPQRIGEREMLLLLLVWLCTSTFNIYIISLEEDLRYVCVVSQPKQAHTTQTRWSSTFIGLRFYFGSHSSYSAGENYYMPTKSRTRK